MNPNVQLRHIAGSLLASFAGFRIATVGIWRFQQFNPSLFALLANISDLSWFTFYDGSRHRAIIPIVRTRRCIAFTINALRFIEVMDFFELKWVMDKTGCRTSVRRTVTVVCITRRMFMRVLCNASERKFSVVRKGSTSCNNGVLAIVRDNLENYGIFGIEDISFQFNRCNSIVFNNSIVASKVRGSYTIDYHLQFKVSGIRIQGYIILLRVNFHLPISAWVRCFPYRTQYQSAIHAPFLNISW